MDYEKLKKTANVSKDNNNRSVATNASIPKIARAQKEQKLYENKLNTSDELKSNNTKVATLSLNVCTETLDPSRISLSELKDAQVGHTWISLKFTNSTSAPTSLGNPTYDLVCRGGTSMGFWPLIYSPEAFSQERESYYTMDQERALGCTPGAGASSNPSHSGFSFWKSVPGRVEELIQVILR